MKLKEIYADARREFREIETYLQYLAKRFENDVAAICAATNIEAIRVESRLKDFEGIRNKYIDKADPGDFLVSLKDLFSVVRDVVGIRVVVFRDSDVSGASQIISERFPGSSTEEKLTAGDLERGSKFGYRAIHIDFEIPLGRELEEYGDATVGGEIQVRTLFSDAWSHHSHRIVHKGKPSDNTIRTFGRMAATLETLDNEIEQVEEGFEVSSPRSMSEELEWNTTFNRTRELVGGDISESELQSIFAIAVFGGDVVDEMAEFEKDVEGAWAEYGDVKYEDYGIREHSTKLKIALLAHNKFRYSALFPDFRRTNFIDIARHGTRKSVIV